MRTSIKGCRSRSVVLGRWWGSLRRHCRMKSCAAADTELPAISTSRSTILCDACAQQGSTTPHLYQVLMGFRISNTILSSLSGLHYNATWHAGKLGRANLYGDEDVGVMEGSSAEQELVEHSSQRPDISGHPIGEVRALPVWASQHLWRHVVQGPLHPTDRSYSPVKRL